MIFQAQIKGNQQSTDNKVVAIMTKDLKPWVDYILVSIAQFEQLNLNKQINRVIK